jgi:hypothetical protein
MQIARTRVDVLGSLKDCGSSACHQKLRAITSLENPC